MKRTVSERSTIVAGKNQLSSDLGEEAVILNSDKGMYYGLDTVGARIWNLIQNPTRVNEIRDALLKEYEVECDRCEHDLLLLLQKLADEGLIEVRDEGAA